MNCLFIHRLMYFVQKSNLNEAVVDEHWEKRLQPTAIAKLKKWIGNCRQIFAVSKALFDIIAISTQNKMQKIVWLLKKDQHWPLFSSNFLCRIVYLQCCIGIWFWNADAGHNRLSRVWKGICRTILGSTGWIDSALTNEKTLCRDN